MWNKIKIHYYIIMSSLRAKTIYPDDIDIDMKNFFDKPSKLKIAIIDDNDFPWVQTLESKGHTVKIFKDYHKTNTKISQKKLIAYQFNTFDLIFCDIEGVGTLAYPGLDGIGVIQDLRELNPLHVVVAFTGSPARLLDPKTGKHFTSLDAVFQRDWGVDDFLLNFSNLTKIFIAPKQRWKFIRSRLVHLDLSESKITKVQKAFTQNVLLLKYLGESTDISKNEIKEIILKSEKNVDIKGVIEVAAISTKAINIASSLFIFNSFK
ncbi:response regulator [Pectobacterium brasiliense]|uniref:response regulator n=1 Tax=Pectobacterium brasiliense TaxID=180957 RepID=UPI0015DD8C62|nr:response regulator [Pectobacterium brasiliense]MBA0216217.1 response regulator [Pectobacterium brasiliense]